MEKDYLDKFVYKALKAGNRVGIDNVQAAIEYNELIAGFLKKDIDIQFVAKRLFFLNLHVLINQFGEEKTVEVLKSREHFALKEPVDAMKVFLENQKDVNDVLIGTKKGLSFKRTFELFALFFKEEED